MDEADFLGARAMTALELADVHGCGVEQVLKVARDRGLGRISKTKRLMPQQTRVVDAALRELLGRARRPVDDAPRGGVASRDDANASRGSSAAPPEAATSPLTARVAVIAGDDGDGSEAARDERVHHHLQSTEAGTTSAERRAEDANARAELAERCAAEERSRAERAEQRAEEASARADLAEQRAGEALARAEQAEQRVVALQTELQAFESLFDREAAPSDSLPEPVGVPLSGVLEARGFASTGSQAKSLRSLLDRPSVARRIIDGLVVSDPRTVWKLVDRYLGPVCSERCESVLASEQRSPVQVGPPHCCVCGGSAVRGAARAMAAECKAVRWRRVLVVGPKPTTRQEIESALVSDDEQVAVRIVDGTDRPGRKRADYAVRSADLLVICTNAVIDHATSDVYEAAASASGVPICPVPLRGAESILEAIRAFAVAQRGCD
jgi:hypothetical protein